MSPHSSYGCATKQQYLLVLRETDLTSKVKELLGRITSFMELKSMYSRTIDLTSPIKYIEARCRETGAISLAQGIPYYSLSKSAHPYLSEKIAAGLCDRYLPPSGMPSLRHSIASYESKRLGLEIGTNQILVSAGAMEGLNCVLHTVLQPGDEVIVPTPTYPAFRNAVVLARGRYIEVPLSPCNDFRLNLDAIESSITPRTKGILFCNPNNPTGVTYPLSIMNELVSLARRNNLLLISDETYRDLCFTGSTCISPLQVPGGDKVSVVIHSFSKTFGTTGWRVGYVIAPEAMTVDVTLMHDSFMTCAPVISQYLAQWSLEYGDYHRHTNCLLMRDAVRSSQYLLEAAGLSCISPEGGYYLFVRPTGEYPTGKEFADALLERYGVGVVPGDAFGETGAGFVRICCSRDPRSLNEGLERIVSCVKASTLVKDSAILAPTVAA